MSKLPIRTKQATMLDNILHAHCIGYTTLPSLCFLCISQVLCCSLFSCPKISFAVREILFLLIWEEPFRPKPLFLPDRHGSDPLHMLSQVTCDWDSPPQNKCQTSAVATYIEFKWTASSQLSSEVGANVAWQNKDSILLVQLLPRVKGCLTSLASALQQIWNLACVVGNWIY